MIEVEHLTKRYGSHTAVDDISFTVEDGGIYGLLGPNGAGKTTILDAICGKNHVSEGKILFFSDKGERDVSRMKEYAISDLGIGRKFQAPSVFTGITIEENMELAVAKRHSLYSTTFRRLTKESREYMNYCLDFIGLSDKRFSYPGSLSHGEKQWLEIGMILASRPKLMLLDEPVAGMGRRETEKTAEMLKNIKKECSIIVVEHDMQFAKEVSDTVTVFHEGEILDEGTMDTVQKNQKVIDVYLGRG